jgi:hypothetical protein
VDCPVVSVRRIATKDNPHIPQKKFSARFFVTQNRSIYPRLLLSIGGITAVVIAGQQQPLGLGIVPGWIFRSFSLNRTTIRLK